MKTKKFLLAALTAMCAMTMTVSMTSCTNDISDNPVINPEPDEPEEDLADATIMWYGHGGGNVDAAIFEDFRQFYKAKTESFKRVNVVAQYKASLNPTIYKDYTDEQIAEAADSLAEGKTEEEIENMNAGPYFVLFHPQRGATYRFLVDPKKTLRQQMLETAPYGEPNCDFTCPDSLTNFINWAAKTYPAKKYILVMADHGGGYLPDQDLADAAATRGLVFDDGHNNKCFSAKSFARGVRNANVRPEGVVLYLCLMNNIEFLYDVKDVTDYVTCSTYVMWGGGGTLYTIVDDMAEGKDTETTLAHFVDSNVDHWDSDFYHPEETEEEWPLYYDLTMTKTSRLNDLALVLREFTDRLVDTYQNGTPEQREAIDFCTANAVKVENTSPFYDFAKYMTSFFAVLPDVFDEDLFNRLADAFNACIVKQRYSRYLTEHNYMVDYSVMLAVRGAYVKYVYDKGFGGDAQLVGAVVFYPDGTKAAYKYIANDEDSSDGSLDNYELVAEGTWPSTFAETYQQTTFDRLVGWSRWLLINESAPPAWSPSTFNFQLPSDDMSGNPMN